MVGQLITLPVRIGVRATRLWFRAVEETVSVTVSTTGRVIELVSHRGSNGAATRSAVAPTPAAPARPAPAERQPPAERPARAARPAPEPPPVHRVPSREDLPPSAQPAPPPPPEPAHVSEEPTLVEEFADPGAEDGAGAQVRVDPPWDGYEHMSAKQVTSRLAGASPEELAAVQLFELTHRRRQTIMNAVERELRKANGHGSRGQ